MSACSIHRRPLRSTSCTTLYYDTNTSFFTSITSHTPIRSHLYTPTLTLRETTTHHTIQPPQYLPLFTILSHHTRRSYESSTTPRVQRGIPREFSVIKSSQYRIELGHGMEDEYGVRYEFNCDFGRESGFVCAWRAVVLIYWRINESLHTRRNTI